MPSYKSYLGCWIPQDKTARAECKKAGIDWKGLDPHTAAMNEIKRIVTLSEADPFKDPPTIEDQKKEITKIEQQIQKELLVQKNLAADEDKERKKEMKKMGEKLLEERFEKEAMTLARNA